MKKTILTATILGMMGIANAGTMPVVYPEYDTVTFKINEKTTVTSDTSLVNVTSHITTLSDKNSSIKKSSVDYLKSILPNADWKIINYKQTESESGAINLRIDFQARLTQSEIDLLRKALNKHSVNQKMTINVLGFNPSKQAVKNAKADLMVKLYQDIQAYTGKFNDKTHSNYHIQHVSYNSDSSYNNNYHTKAMVMYGDNMAENTSSKNIAVSKDINISANITLAKKASVKWSKLKPAHHHHSRLIGGKAGLPPAYLSVDGFKQCLSTKDMGGWRSYCIPEEKLDHCKQESWDQLSKMDMPHCDV
jgi:hypothetical protein